MGGTISRAARSPSSISRPATRHWRRSSSGTQSASGIGPAARRSPCPAGLPGLPWTCATCPCDCPSAVTGGARRSRPGASWPGRATSSERPMIESRPATHLTDSLDGIELVTKRPLVVSPVDAFFGLQPGDRPLVKSGEAVGRGQPIVEHYRDPRTMVVAGAVAENGVGVPGDRLAIAPGRRPKEGEPTPGGELLFRSAGTWRVAGGDGAEPIEAPFAGVAHQVRPGPRATLRSTLTAITGRSGL